MEGRRWRHRRGDAVLPDRLPGGQRYPLVVQTHGGPQASDKYGFGRWGNYTQVLTAKGYMVLQPNYRGSTGYGDAFLRDMVGHYFINAHLDVMAGVDQLINLGIVDGNRMAKMGWSGGGHMTNKIITFTEPLQGGRVRRRRRKLDLDVRAERRADLPDAVVRRHAVAGQRAHRRLLEQFAAQGRVEGDHTDHLPRRRRGRPRAEAAIGRDVPRVEEPRRTDASLCRAPRAAWLGRAAARAVQGERRARLVREVRDRAGLHVGEGARRRGRRPGHGRPGRNPRD